MGAYYNPTNGNFEVWETKPEGYLTKEEFDALHPIKYFALVGANKAERVSWKGSYTLSNPEMIEMVSAPIGDYHIAQADGTWACDVEKYRTEKVQEIANARWLYETAGMPFNGNVIKTDRESVALLKGAYDEACKDSSYTVNWKGEEGFITLNAEQIITIYQRVRAHVQSAFDAEMMIGTQIAAATTEAELDAIHWIDPNGGED